MSKQETVERRSANYAPSLWTDRFIQSQTSEYLEEKYMEQVEKLKEKVRGLLEKKGTLVLEKLELIDVLQRLGVEYHFRNEIHEILSALHQKQHDDTNNNNSNMSMYQQSLLFRLLRQDGYSISHGMFKMFMEEGGKFEERQSEDVKGLVSLYEACYLGITDEEEEGILEEAKGFCIHQLSKKCGKYDGGEEMGMMDVEEEEEVRYALEMPLHWRMKRVEARRFIDVYEKRRRHGSSTVWNNKDDEDQVVLLDLAKLDYNILQALHLEELKQLSRWHQDIHLAESLGSSYARSRVVEAFLWALGVTSHPNYPYCRNVITKATEFVTVIDDVYDVYATSLEAQTLTHAIQGWDVNAIEEVDLPVSIKVCLLALFNYVNLIAYDFLRQLGINVLPYLKQGWVGLAKAYLKEAKWYHGGHKPSLDEYLENGWVSISVPVVLLESYVAMTVDREARRENKKSKEEIVEDVQFLLRDRTLIRFCSNVVRLTDDLGTSSHELQRGDVPKAVQCHMNDNPGCSEDEARKFIVRLIEDNWRKMNAWVVANAASPRPRFFPDFVAAVLNGARVSHCFYQYGDGYGRPEGIAKQRISSLFFQPLPMHP